MSINSPDEITAKASRGRPGIGFLRLLHAVALIAVVVGAVGSVGLMLWIGHRNPSRVLLGLFVIWDLCPFVALLLADMVSKRWSVLTRATLYCFTLVLALGSLAIYGELIHLRPPGSANAFLFVAVPPVSWVFVTIVVSMAALISRTRTRGRP